MLGGQSNKPESLFSPQAHLTARVNGAKQSSQHFPTATRGLNQDYTALRGAVFLPSAPPAETWEGSRAPVSVGL